MTGRIRKTDEPRAATSRPFAWATIAILALSGAPLGSPLGAQLHGEGPVVLRLPTNARLLALGNASLASNDGDAFLHNPGMLSFARGVSASLQRYGANGASGAIASVTPLGSMFLGVGAQFVDWRARGGSSYADAVLNAPAHLSDSGAVAASSSAFAVGFAKTVKGQRLGASVKYAEDRFGAAHDGTVAVDLGMSMPLGPMTMAIAAQNLGAGLRMGGSDGPLPRRIGIGFGSGLQPAFAHWDIGFQTQVTLENDWFVRPAGGVEVGYVPIEGVSLIVRSGLRLPREKDEPLATGGLGIVIDRISIDYAAEPFRGRRPIAHRVGIRIR